MTATPLRRATVTAAAATLAGLGLLTATPAHAVSDELSYTCSLFALPDGFPIEDLGTEERRLLDSAKEGELAPEELAAEIPEIIELDGLKATATFDSAIEDGARVVAGTSVELEPVSGTFTLSPEIGDALRELEIPDAVGGAFVFTSIEETGLERGVEFYFDSVTIPASGEVTLSSEDGFTEAFRAHAPGTYTYVAGDFDLFVGTEEGETAAFAGISCVLDEDQDPTIDQVVATAASTPTPTPTPTTPPAGPVRPDVVQTDVAQPTSPTWLPLAATGVGSVLVLGAASRLTRRSARRR